MGYNPSTWGRQAWHFIHMVALSYPPKEALNEEVKEKYYKFFESLGYTLPCPYCSQHFREKFQKNPPPMESREELFEWTVDIHNSVNRDNGKRELTYQEAKRQIFKNAENKSNDYMIYGVAVSVSLITMICLFGYSMRKKG
jgi:hypothetical protein